MPELNLPELAEGYYWRISSAGFFGDRISLRRRFRWFGRWYFGHETIDSCIPMSRNDDPVTMLNWASRDMLRHYERAKRDEQVRRTIKYGVQ